MKFWQLMAITRNTHEDLVWRVAKTRPEWKTYELLANTYSDLVVKQERAALDSIVDMNFVEAVLAEDQQKLFLSEDGWLRSRQCTPRDRPLSALDVFRRYGADMLEETLERGSAKVA